MLIGLIDRPDHASRSPMWLLGHGGHVLCLFAPPVLRLICQNHSELVLMTRDDGARYDKVHPAPFESHWHHEYRTSSSTLLVHHDTARLDVLSSKKRPAGSCCRMNCTIQIATDSRFRLGSARISTGVPPPDLSLVLALNGATFGNLLSCLSSNHVWQTASIPAAVLAVMRLMLCVTGTCLSFHK